MSRASNDSILMVFFFFSSSTKPLKSLQCFPRGRLFAHYSSLTSLQCGQLLQSLTNSKSLCKGRKLHAHMLVSGTLHHNSYLNSKLAAFYAICGCMSQAREVFDETMSKNSFLWNSMIRGYASRDSPVESIVLYREMLRLGQRADRFTYPFVLKACGELLSVKAGRIVHSEAVVNGLVSDVYVGNSLMSMYSKLGDLQDVRKVFDRMPERDLTSWSTVILSHAKNGDPKEAVDVFRSMGRAGVVADGTTLLAVLDACGQMKAIRQGREIHAFVVRNSSRARNEFVGNSIIGMYCDCKSTLEARKLFESINRDLVSWNLMISGYSQNGDPFQSIKLFSRMVRQSLEHGPDEVTITAILGACDQIMALQFGMSVHSYLAKRGFNANHFVGTALVNMYSKCGSLSCSHLAFNELPQRSLFSWSSIISGYGVHGRGREALFAFNKMVSEGLKPDEAVLTSVLSACSHSGLVDEGKEIFESMKREFDLKPTCTHYSCLVDILGRAGKLNEAFELIENLEFKPTRDMWAALLSACWLHRNIELAEIAAQRMSSGNPEDVSSYICLSNIYAAEKRWADVQRLRAMMRGQRLRKPPGQSFIELDKKIHRFLVADKSHEQSDAIYAKLKDLREQLEMHGYSPDTIVHRNPQLWMGY
ncbi:hypothetical protein CDL15_Pgr010791 [Punica granatum]|uniref:Uncharacterized protein n=1 Tax=Punica granatum TaxID=22663 RepID=A0A218W5N2_PUNGR|nr:hypothetical protein CDL15_Pgr010791 [Punica granatum]